VVVGLHFAVPSALLFPAREKVRRRAQVARTPHDIGNGYLEERCHDEGLESSGLDPNAAAVKALKERSKWRCRGNRSTAVRTRFI